MLRLLSIACLLWLLVGGLPLGQPAATLQDAGYDLIIRKGKLVDGSGNPWHYGDVAVRGNKIVAMGRILPGSAKREIDASGLIVAPGFIDIHSHSDTQQTTGVDF